MGRVVYRRKIACKENAVHEHKNKCRHFNIYWFFSHNNSAWMIKRMYKLTILVTLSIFFLQTGRRGSLSPSIRSENGSLHKMNPRRRLSSKFEVSFYFSNLLRFLRALSKIEAMSHNIKAGINFSKVAFWRDNIKTSSHEVCLN